MKKVLIIILILALAVGLVVGGTYVTYANVVNIDTIYKGISVNGVDVSDLTVDEALEKVKSVDNKKTSEVKLLYNDYEFSYDFESLGYKPDYEQGVKEAYEYAREGTPGERFLKVTELNSNPLDISVKGEFNVENVEEVIAHLNNVISYQPSNANFSIVNDEVIITSEQPGYSVNNDEIKELILNSVENNEPINIPVEELAPEITSDFFQALKGEIGSFSTNYASSVQNRKENIKLSADIINGTTIMPGQTISFNDIIGEISANTGFLPATVILNGEYETGTGGGICQVSTTLYNAAVKADLKIDERRNHSRPVNYVPMGMDAAVASGLLDLKITNTFDFPVYIKATADNSDIRFSIIGDTDKKNYDVELVAERAAVLSNTTKNQYTNSLPQGKTEIAQAGYTGYSYSSYKIKSINGEVISREGYLSSHYPSKDTIINVGTGN